MILLANAPQKMGLALLVVLVCMVWLQLIRLSALRREVERLMEDNKVADEVISELCDVILEAQSAEADHVDARAKAMVRLSELDLKTSLTDDTKQKLALVLGNAVGAPPVQAVPVNEDLPELDVPQARLDQDDDLTDDELAELDAADQKHQAQVADVEADEVADQPPHKDADKEV